MPNQVSLATLRTNVRQRSNQEGSQFVTDAEINGYVQASWQELYDLLMERQQEQYAKASASFAISGATDTYSWATLGVTDFYKGLGVDIQVGGQYWQPLRRFNFAERGNGTALSPLYVGVPGLYDLRYQIRGDALVFMQPVPSATCRLWYIPVAPSLVLDTDTIDDVNGYSEYVTLDAAIKVMVKEESDPSALMGLKEAMRQRVISASASRDVGGVTTIADTSSSGWGWL